jgi:hypothetical protein
MHAPNRGALDRNGSCGPKLLARTAAKVYIFGVKQRGVDLDTSALKQKDGKLFCPNLKL